MVTRIITSVVALAVLAGVLISPPVVFNIVLCAVILVMLDVYKRQVYEH